MARSTLEQIRSGLMIILLIGLVGTSIELYLIRHTEGAWELVPLVLVIVGLPVAVWCITTSSAAAIRALQALMMIYLVSGLVGTVLHFKANVGFEAESNPSLSGRDLYWVAFQGASPTLAPGTMIQLGLVGLLFAFRHPNLPRTREGGTPSH